MSDAPITIASFDEAKDTYRQKDLRQALYDAGEVIMGDVLVNLHGAEHRDRRRLENRLFRRETFELYENTLFPPIIADTLRPHLEAGRAELVDLGHQMGAQGVGDDRWEEGVLVELEGFASEQSILQTTSVAV
ncbi:MAG: hypothetical protein ACKOA6_01370, partial [Actinomycetota bacterium]